MCNRSVRRRPAPGLQYSTVCSLNRCRTVPLRPAARNPHARSSEQSVARTLNRHVYWSKRCLPVAGPSVGRRGIDQAGGKEQQGERHTGPQRVRLQRGRCWDHRRQGVPTGGTMWGLLNLWGSPQPATEEPSYIEWFLEPDCSLDPKAALRGSGRLHIGPTSLQPQQKREPHPITLRSLIWVVPCGMLEAVNAVMDTRRLDEGFRRHKASNSGPRALSRSLLHRCTIF